MKFFLFWVTVAILAGIFVWGLIISEKVMIYSALGILAVVVIGTIISDAKKK